MNKPSSIASPCTHTLDIDGMSGDACVQKVTGALKGVHGVSTQSVKVGSAVIRSEKDGCTAACAAIDNAGFKSREHGSKPRNAKDAANATPSSTPAASKL